MKCKVLGLFLSIVFCSFQANAQCQTSGSSYFQAISNFRQSCGPYDKSRGHDCDPTSRGWLCSTGQITTQNQSNNQPVNSTPTPTTTQSQVSSPTSPGACSVSAANFGQALTRFRATCGRYDKSQGHDCDPTANGWTCSTGQVGGLETASQNVTPTPVVTAPSAQPAPAQPNPTPVAAPAPAPAPAPSASSSDSDCSATDIRSLKRCIAEARSGDSISLVRNIQCSGADCCSGNSATLNFAGRSNLIIDGNGHTLLRRTGQRQCSMIDINGGSNITFSDITFDDDSSVAGCVVNDNCPRMLHIRNANNIMLNQVHVTNGKGYVIYVNRVNGFTFLNSRLTNSGVLGLYVGHGDNTPSTNVTIRNSVFTDNSTNAIALLGVVGNSLSSNIVEGNTFERNHHIGQWLVAPQFRDGAREGRLLTGGGQVYIAQANNFTFRNNTIKDGSCSNCYLHNGALRTGITGLELGTPGKASLRNGLVEGNTIFNNHGFGVSLNANSTLNNIVIRNNTVYNNGINYQNTLGVN